MSSPRHFLSVIDLSVPETREVLDLAREMKKNPGEYRTVLEGKTLAMIFQKRSTRTRVSFEVGMWQLGGHALFLSSEDLQLGRGESIADTARVLSRYADVIMARVYGHNVLLEMGRFAAVPVINGLSDALHPCQILADLQTIEERFGTLKGLKTCFVGDGNNVARSLMLGGVRLGMDVTVVSPPGYEPPEQYVEVAKGLAADAGSKLEITNDPAEGVRGAHVVYSDVWVSMGMEEDHSIRLGLFQGYQVDPALMSRAHSDAVFMHCLPAHRGEEVSADVADGPQSIIFDQAENRLHAQKALMAYLCRASACNE